MTVRSSGPLYCKVLRTAFTGDTFRGFRGDPYAQAMVGYMLAPPTGNWLGVTRLPVVLVAHDLGWSVDQTQRALDVVCASGFAEYDAPSETLWVVRYAEIQIGALQPSDHRVVAVRRDVAAFAKSPIHARFVERYRQLLCLVGPLPSKEKRAPAPAARKGTRPRARPVVTNRDADTWDSVTKPDFVPGPRLDWDPPLSAYGDEQEAA